MAETWAVTAPPVQGSEPRRREPDVISGPCGYLADRGKVTSVRWLGLALAALTVIGAMPAAKDYYYFAGAPAWAQVILLVTALQLIYVIWMVSLPDWSTVWVLMLVFALTSAMYGFTLAVTFFTPVDRALLLDLTDVRRTAPAWCGAMLLFTFLGAFLCGRYSFRWYKAYVLASAARG